MAIVIKDLEDLRDIGPGTVKLLLRLEQIDQRISKGSSELFGRLTRFEELSDRSEARAERMESQAQQTALELRAELKQMNRSLHILASAAVTFLESRPQDRPPEPFRPEPTAPPVERRKPPPIERDASDDLGDYFLSVLRADERS